MLEKLRKFYNNIKELNKSINNYQKDTIIQSLPSVAYVNRAKKLIEQRKFKEAEKILTLALDLSNQDPNVFKYLGKIREYYKDFSAAVDFYNVSAKLNPNDKEIWLRLGMSLLYSEDFSNALYAFEKADKRTPHNTDVYTGWGMAYMRMKKYALARDKFNTAAQISQYNYSAILLSAVMEKRLGQYIQSEEKLNFLAKVAPNEGCIYELAHLKLIQKKYNEAENLTYKVLDYNKQMLPAYFMLGKIYSIQRDYDKCANIYNQAIANDLDCASLHFEWGKSYVRLLEFEKAKEQFEIALSKEPEFVEAKIGMALINAYKGDFTLTDEYSQKHYDNVYIMESLGLKHYTNGDFKQAINCFNKALKTDDNQSYLYFDLVQCYIALKNNDKTRENFDKFTIQNPHYLNGFLKYSDWLIENSDFDEARRKLEKAFKIAPQNTEILNKLFFVQYTLVKKNISEYNIKEAIATSQQAQMLGSFNYYPEVQELEQMLDNIREER